MVDIDIFQDTTLIIKYGIQLIHGAYLSMLHIFTSSYKNSAYIQAKSSKEYMTYNIEKSPILFRKFVTKEMTSEDKFNDDLNTMR